MENSDYRFSVWRNLTESKESTDTWDIDDLIAAIKSGKGPNSSFFDSIRRLRNNRTKEEKKIIKQFELPAVTLSCTCSPRNSAGFIDHSGLMQVDLDDVHDFDVTMKKVQNDRYTFVCFKSPSGNGIKGIVKVHPDKDRHLLQFNALEKYYLEKLNLTIDKACKDLARCMLLSHDEAIFHNPEAELFPHTYLSPTKSRNSQKRPSKPNHIYSLRHFEQPDQQIEGLINLLTEKRIDITRDYENWYRIAYGLQSEFGESGRSYFHQISQFHERYSVDECNRKFDCACRSNNNRIGMGTLIHIASAHGVKFTPKGSTTMAAEPNMKAYKSSKPSSPNIESSIEAESSSSKIEFNPKEKELFDALRKTRLELARQEDVKAFQIFSNSTLYGLVWAKPITANDLLKCRGIGPQKLLGYGETIISVIKKHS